MTTVSIALCTYNGQRYLQRQLETLAEQSVLPDEVVICDDASSDHSVQIAQTFARTAPFAVHIHQNTQNLGYIKNFEKAISLCTRDIVFMCDQDDMWAADKIKQVVQIFDAELETGLVLHDFCWIDGQDQPWPGPVDTYGPSHLSAKQLPEEIKARSIHVFMHPYPRAWCGCMMAFRRSFNSIILPIFPGKGHDDWILKVLAPVTQTRFIAAPLVQYRMHERNTNRRDLDARTMKYLWGRLVKKATFVLKGYNKRNFYRLILRRLRSSDLPIKFPSLISLYKKYA
jgi:glycosyltransferase involved in cell wall biosynthesis